jgi:hypothetical protein
MKRAPSSCSDNAPPKKRRTRAYAVPNISSRHSGTRHVRLAERGRRLTQRRKDQQTTYVPLVYAIDDSVDPDDAIQEWVDEPQDPPPEEPIVVTAKPKKRPPKSMSVRGFSVIYIPFSDPIPTQSKLSAFLAFRDSFLDELARHDGFGDGISSPQCYSCGEAEGTIKCRDCFTQLLRCRTCVAEEHKDLPFHRLQVLRFRCVLLFFNLQLCQVWNGRFFEKLSLKDLGLRYQLGHGGAKCPMPSPGPSNLLVFDTSGVHSVAVDFCDCGQSGHVLHQRTQFLRARWFPATFDRPKTVFTFDCLATFHELTLQGKTTPFDFYHMILRRTDNVQLSKPIVGLSFIRVFVN